MTNPAPLPNDQRIAARSDEYEAKHGADDLAEAMARALTASE